MKFGVHAEPAPAPLAQMLEKLKSLELQDPEFPVALTIQAPELDQWQWLNANCGTSRIVWFDRATAETTAGLGSAAEIVLPEKGDVSSCITQAREILKNNGELKFFGGFSFDGRADWASFGAGRFLVPRLQLIGDRLTLAVMDADDIPRARHELQQINFAPGTGREAIPEPVSRNYSPPVDGWQSRIDEALSLIRNEVLEKIVLSRKTILNFSAPLNEIVLTERLKETTHDCFVFCFNFEDSKAFLGATPERLFFREDQTLESEVVAGTRMRGDTPAADEKLAIELLTSDKDQREHDIVRKSIRQKLHKYIDHLEVDNQASILRLARKQHLRSNVHGTLKPGVDDGMLLERLHPTPAVGGYPTDNALPEIARIEPFNRGWYAAPVGWIGSDSAHFAVAIRSGLVEGESLSLFSGAGIVRGSTPEQEWQEVENKIQDFLSILGR